MKQQQTKTLPSGAPASNRNHSVIILSINTVYNLQTIYKPHRNTRRSNETLSVQADSEELVLADLAIVLFCSEDDPDNSAHNNYCSKEKPSHTSTL